MSEATLTPPETPEEPEPEGFDDEYKELDATTLRILERCPPPMSGDNLTRHFKAIFYGDFDTWKTVTACRFGRTLILAHDPGWKSYLNHPELAGQVAPVNYVGYLQLEAYTAAIIARHPDYTQYDTFVIDTIGGIQEDYVDSVVRGSKINKQTRPVFTPTNRHEAANLPLRELPGVDDYHIAKNVLRPTIRKLNKAPVNVIYIAHEREPNDQEIKANTKTLKYKRPAITEALFKVIARDVDLIAHFERDGDEATVSFRRLKDTVAKSRIKELNGKVIPTDMVEPCIKRWQAGKPIFANKETK